MKGFHFYLFIFLPESLYFLVFYSSVFDDKQMIIRIFEDL